MRIAFADRGDWDYHATTVDGRPMGGSQSAATYLARSLAALGHSVFLLTHTTQPGIHGGVTCLSWNDLDPGKIRALELDVVVLLLGFVDADWMRESLAPATKLILWTQHAADQPSIEPLQEPWCRGIFDGVVVVSDWQRDQFIREMHFDPAKLKVLRNAVSPAFRGLFPPGESILAHKSDPPILAYTSTPFRGLNVLLDVFPAIRAQVPGVRLQVYSSMKVYQYAARDDEAMNGALYERCRSTAGIEYIGSRPQSELADALRKVSVLAYPNTFAETSCIAVMEALAAGCRVVTSALGALPETGAGFASLIHPPRTREEYEAAFVAETVRVLREMTADRNATEAALRRQVDAMDAESSWELRAREWATWLESVPRCGAAIGRVPATVALEAAADHFNSGRLAKAESLCRAVLAENERCADAYYVLGNIAAQVGRRELAISLLQRALSLDPEAPQYRADLQAVLGKG